MTLINTDVLCSYLFILSTFRLLMGSSADTPSPTDSCPSSLILWWTWSLEQVIATLPLIQRRQNILSIMWICSCYFIPGHAAALILSELLVSNCLYCIGAVKVTPAHDHSDFLLSERHSLPRLTVIRGDGTMTPPCGQWLEVREPHCYYHVNTIWSLWGDVITEGSATYKIQAMLFLWSVVVYALTMFVLLCVL